MPAVQLRFPSPPPAGKISLDEFCGRYGLGKRIKDGLKALDFEVGDDVRILRDSDWTKADITPLAQNRLRLALEALKADIVAGVIFDF